MRHSRSFICVFLLPLAMVGCGNDSTSDATGDRAQIAFFRASGNGVYDLGIADDRGHNLEILTGESMPGSVWPQLFTELSWSPDGKRIAFAGGKGPQTDEHDEPTDLYVIGVDGSEARRVTDFGDVSNPLWSPGGERILFTRTKLEHGRPSLGELWSARPDGSELTQLTERMAGRAYLAGSFSSDGSRIVVTRVTFDPESGKGTAAVYIMRADGSGERKLIDGAAEPALSPDGKRIVFSTARDRNGELCYGDQCSPAGELYIAKSDGTSAKRLTRTKGVNEAAPSWFPDGSRIVYQGGEVVDNAQGTGVFQMNPDGSCARRMLSDPRLDTWYANPAVRPNPPRGVLGPLRC